MKKLINIPIFTFLLVMSACDKKEEPELSPTPLKISFIAPSDDNQETGYCEVFNYTNDNLISSWEYKDENNDIAIRSSYEYRDDTILIACNEIKRNWHYEERLYLNPNGTANRAEGRARVYDSIDPSHVVLIKNYIVNFKYNSLNQLTDISISEKRANDNGWEESNSLDWSVKLTWDNNNLKNYSEFHNSSSPYIDVTYSYYDGTSINYMPILNRPILRSYYLPLQYQGVLGKQSEDLIKSYTVSQPQSFDYIKYFSYDLSLSVRNSMVENYYEKCNGKEIKYVVGWD